MNHEPIDAIDATTTSVLPESTRPKLFVLVGMPTSGKTNWCDKRIHDYGPHVIIRPEPQNNNFIVNEDKAFTEDAITKFITAVKNKENIIIDAQNLSYNNRHKWINLAPDYITCIYSFHIETNVLLSRLTQRGKSTGSYIPLGYIDYLKSIYEPVQVGEASYIYDVFV